MRPGIPRLASVAVLAALACTPACTVRPKGVDGNGQWSSENRPLRGFSKIVLRGPLDAKVREGGEHDVTVWIDSNLRSFVATTIAGDTLVIDATQVIYPVGRALVDVRLPRLDAVTTEGSGRALVTTTEPHPDLDLTVRGSGDLVYKGTAEKIDASNGGSGTLKLSGTAQRLDAEIKSSGDIDAREMPVVGGRFEINGSGDILANLRGGELSAKINGSGDLRYSGTARVTSVNKTGSGTVGQL